MQGDELIGHSAAAFLIIPTDVLVTTTSSSVRQSLAKGGARLIVYSRQVLSILAVQPFLVGLPASRHARRARSRASSSDRRGWTDSFLVARLPLGDLRPASSLPRERPECDAGSH